jgi:hypothetical protein
LLNRNVNPPFTPAWRFCHKAWRSNSRFVEHVSTMNGWTIILTHFANWDLADVWVDQ